MEFNDDNIQSFWQWFVKNESTIKACIENEDSPQKEYVVDQMNEQILGLGVFTWDLGLNDEDNWFLMISPNGNPDMLAVSQKIMAEAPEHMNWLFHACRPAKNWGRQFTVYDDYMDEQFVDATSWHYIVFDDEGGGVELVIEANNISHLDPEVADTAAEQFVIQEIGELLWIREIASLDIVDSLDSEDESSKRSVAELKTHLAG